MQDAVFECEGRRLEFTKAEMRELLIVAQKIFVGLPSKYGDDPRLLENMMSLYAAKIKNIQNGLDKPYFARIDFDGLEENKNLYIGKVGMLDRENHILITDWRAPVSSLYYNSHLGHASYEAPGGIVEGELSLKRQLIVEEGILSGIYDVDAVSDDELLKPYLGASADSRLKNIVASIQKEQNDIIRKPLRDSVIVQGVAGSGKTTVALHRIAYLVYNYSKQFNAEQFLVIGPNKFFINYISSVLPDLDVGNAEQLTYEEFARGFIGEALQIRSPTSKLTDFIAGEQPDPYLAYKTSMLYKDALDAFFAEYESDFFKGEGLTVNSFPLLSGQELYRRCHSYPAPDMASRLQMAALSFAASLRDDAALSARVRAHFDALAARSPDKADALFAKRADVLKQQQTGFGKALKKHLSVSKEKVLPLYLRFVERIERYSAQEPALLTRLQRETKKAIGAKKVDFEDVPALIYLKYLLCGNGNCSAYVHTVVDEAQDFGVFSLYVLKLLMNKCSFSIFGDLTQGIYSYRSTRNWEDVSRQVFADECAVMRLEKSYRTTIEIMNAANLISLHLGLGEGKPVIRHGEPVQITRISAADKIDRICALLDADTKKEFRSVAIISKTPAASAAVYEQLSARGVPLELITEDNETYRGGICSLTCYLAKGLEFDAVILFDTEAEMYQADSELDMKLLYVAMTRALHRLELFCSGNVPLPLRALEEAGREKGRG